MSTGRLWAISGGVAALVAVLIVVLVLTSPSSAPDAGATPTPTPTATLAATPTATATPAPTPSPTPTGPVTPTCETVLTDAFMAGIAAKGWQTWNAADGQGGPRPFDGFPQGAPVLQLVCRSGASPDAADAAADRAWARIDPESGVAAMQQLEASGFTRTDTADGVYLTASTAAYLFSGVDVRWAPTRAGLADLRPPVELG